LGNRREKDEKGESNQRKRRLLVDLTLDSFAVSEVLCLRRTELVSTAKQSSGCAALQGLIMQRPVFVLHPAKICSGKEAIASASPMQS
jgi:hypothetical protein